MPIEQHHTYTFASPFDLYNTNPFFQNFDRALDDAFHLFTEAFQDFDKEFNLRSWESLSSKRAYMHTQGTNDGGYKCFMQRIDKTDQLSPRLQKTMLAVGRSVCEWEGNSEFKSSFDAYFRKLEQYESSHRRRPEAFANIKAGRALVAQAAAGYDSLTALHKEVRARQNALKLQAPSEQRDSRLHILDEIERELDHCVLPKELTEASVADYTAQADDLTARLKQRMDVEVGEVECAPRQDVRVTDSAAKSCFNKTSPSTHNASVAHARSTAASPVSQADITAQKNETIKAVDNAIAEYAAFFAQANADGISLRNFEDLRHLRVGFWETQKALATQCHTFNQLLQWQADVEEALTIDRELFKQLNLACSYAHTAHPLYAGNLSQAGHIAEEIMRDIARVDAHEREKVGTFAFAPLSFEQLNALVKASPAAATLKPKLGALEAFLLADRRSNTLLFETLAQEQRFFSQKGEDEIAAEYDAIIATYKSLLAEGEPRENLHPEKLATFISRWNEARAVAEAKRDSFREALKQLA